MKIFHFLYDHIYNPWVGGGGAVRAFEIYKRLSCRHQITVVSGKYPGAKDYEEEGIQFRFVGTEIDNYALSTFGYAFSSMHFLRRMERRPDLVIEDFAVWNPLFSNKILRDVPVVLQIQNYLGREILRKYLLAGLPFYVVERHYPQLFKHWVVVGTALNKRFRIDGRVIQNGINDFFEEDLREGEYAAFLGRLDVHQKGLDILIMAADRGVGPLKIAGNGRDRDRVIKMIEGKPHIEWVKEVNEEAKKDFLLGAQFLVLPSRFEGQGIVVLEAAAYGKPVIVSDIPELRYAVDAGFGLSFRVGDAKELAEKIRLLKRNEYLRREMGRKAREYARNFTWDRIALEYEAFLLKVVENSKI